MLGSKGRKERSEKEENNVYKNVLLRAGVMGCYVLQNDVWRQVLVLHNFCLARVVWWPSLT